MASLQERRDKSGKLISYSVRVHRGRGADGKQLKPYTATFDVQPTWTEKTARKKAETFAAQFEKECLSGLATDTRLKFQEYCEYVITLKEQRGAKHLTITDYKQLAARIYPYIGHIKLRDLRADHLNNLYSELAKEGMNKHTGGKLGNKRILAHHRLIHTVLEQATKESLIPFNPADRVELPKIERSEPECIQPENIQRINEVLSKESIKWQTLVHMFLITGCRRGEILGLKWENIDLTNSRIYICNNVLYTPERGIYEDTPKTAKSIRYVSLPSESIQELKKYRAWQAAEILRLGEYYERNGFVFSQDNGKPMHPDSVTTWLDRFSKKNNLPHIHPHQFRHTAASMLFYNGVDAVSISKRLGHAQVSTTANIYAHAIEAADQKNADILAEIFLKQA